MKGQGQGLLSEKEVNITKIKVTIKKVRYKVKRVKVKGHGHMSWSHYQGHCQKKKFGRSEVHQSTNVNVICKGHQKQDQRC